MSNNSTALKPELKALSSANTSNEDKANTDQNTPEQTPPSWVKELASYYATDNYYEHWLRCFVYTDGVQFLAEQAQAYWLLDAIASYQPKLLLDPALKHYQLWMLKVDLEKKTGLLLCNKDIDKSDEQDLVVRQEIGFTDFPLAEIKLYLIDKVLLLRSEY